MSMRPVDLQSIISGVKETEKVQRAHEVRSQQQAHDLEVTMRRRERDEPKTVHGVSKGEASRVVERKREEAEHGGGGKKRRDEGALPEGKDGGEGEDKGEPGVYNGTGRMRSLVEEGPHDIVV